MYDISEETLWLDDAKISRDSRIIKDIGEVPEGETNEG